VGQPRIKIHIFKTRAIRLQARNGIENPPLQLIARGAGVTDAASAVEPEIAFQL
jgi:hypothetical protein